MTKVKELEDHQWFRENGSSFSGLNDDELNKYWFTVMNEVREHFLIENKDMYGYFLALHFAGVAEKVGERA